MLACFTSLSGFFLGNGNCARNKDAEKQEEGEHLLLISQYQPDTIVSCVEGMEQTYLITHLKKKNN